MKKTKMASDAAIVHVNDGTTIMPLLTLPSFAPAVQYSVKDGSVNNGNENNGIIVYSAIICTYTGSVNGSGNSIVFTIMPSFTMHCRCRCK